MTSGRAGEASVRGAPVLENRFCGICGNAAYNQEFQVEELMFGSKASFTYLRCDECGCLQLADVPDDLSRFYPTEYYSYRGGDGEVGVGRRLAGRLRASMVLRGWPLPSRLPGPTWRAWFPAGTTKDSAIFDMGCGNGARLTLLRREGFTRLAGFDPLLPSGAVSPEGIDVSRTVKGEWLGAFDLVMFHHSLEHMPDQAKALRLAVNLLRPGGEVLVRIPLSDSSAFDFYGRHWVQLDAPRHLFLHSRKSLSLLASQAALEVTDVTYDSTGFQFWGSELYQRGAQLHGTEIRQHFSPEALKGFEQEALRLNAEGRGDQAAFRLRRSIDVMV
jgi:SAM-dependent methyltransferase